MKNETELPAVAVKLLQDHGQLLAEQDTRDHRSQRWTERNGKTIRAGFTTVAFARIDSEAELVVARSYVARRSQLKGTERRT